MTIFYNETFDMYVFFFFLNEEATWKLFSHVDIEIVAFLEISMFKDVKRQN